MSSLATHATTRRAATPRHLWVGDAQSNIQDSADKRRHFWTSPDYAEQQRRAKAKLDWDKVTEIRARVSRGEPASILAEEFGVAKRTINAIVGGQRWPEQRRPPAGPQLHTIEAPRRS